MRTYLLRRLLLAAPTLLGITLVTFLIIQLAPGNPAELKLQGAENTAFNSPISREMVEETRKLYGLDKPLPVRYLIWLKQVCLLEFGDSYVDHRPVMDKIFEALPVTLTLNLISLFLVYFIAIPWGAYSSTIQNSRLDMSATVFLFILYSLPSFWVAMLLIFFLGGGEFWNLFPIAGLTSQGFEGFSIWGKILDVAHHAVLPVFCLTYGSLAYLSRFARVSMLEVIRQDYIRTARAKGLPERTVIFKHALRNSLLPLITILSMTLPALLGGSVIIESIFSLPGLGKLGFESILSRDYPVIMALTTISAFLTLAGILIGDVLYVLADPRISFEEKARA